MKIESRKGYMLVRMMAPGTELDGAFVIIPTWGIGGVFPTGEGTCRIQWKDYRTPEVHLYHSVADVFDAMPRHPLNEKPPTDAEREWIQRAVEAIGKPDDDTYQHWSGDENGNCF